VWLVQATDPEIIVDLGVDYGYSTFCFALPGIGRVYVPVPAVFVSPTSLLFVCV
jgi:hypothetical protein